MRPVCRSYLLPIQKMVSVTLDSSISALPLPLALPLWTCKSHPLKRAVVSMAYGVAFKRSSPPEIHSKVLVALSKQLHLSRRSLPKA